MRLAREEFDAMEKHQAGAFAAHIVNSTMPRPAATVARVEPVQTDEQRLEQSRAYQREYMRKRRAEQAAKRSPNGRTAEELQARREEKRRQRERTTDKQSAASVEPKPCRTFASDEEREAAHIEQQARHSGRTVEEVIAWRERQARCLTIPPRLTRIVQGPNGEYHAAPAAD